MKSRLYDCEVLHARATPKRHQFRYHYFTFCLDLDEIDELGRKHLFLGESFGKLFRFQVKDFIFSEGKTGKIRTVDFKEAIFKYVREKGVTTPIARVELVAHMRTLGYAFNPAAFYFCYSKDEQPICAILEVTNTYGEKKAYFLGPDTLKDGAFRSLHSKLFYVSPFVDLESSFDMILALPGDSLRLQIDSKQQGALLVHTLVTGCAAPISDLALAKRFISNPLITLGVMARIHYQALRLYLKKVPFLKKSDRLEFQKGGLK
jgi:DUF1365 family protein